MHFSNKRVGTVMLGILYLGLTTFGGAIAAELSTILNIPNSLGIPDEAQEIGDFKRIACCARDPNSVCCNVGSRSGSPMNTIEQEQMMWLGFESADRAPRAFASASTESASPGCETSPISVPDLTEVVHYAESGVADACVSAAGAYRTLTQDKNFAKSLSWDQTYEIRLNYFRDCMGAGPTSAKTSETLQPLMNEIGQQVGLISYRGRAPKCMATQFGSAIVTAKHCFEVKRLEDKMLVAKTYEDFSFTPLSSGKALKITGVFTETDPGLVAKAAAPLMYDHLEDDWVILTVSEEAQSDKVGLVVADKLEKSSDAKIYIPSLFLDLDELYPAGDVTWPETVLIDFSPTCRIGARDDNFMLHGCSTLGGVSGAPIIRYRESAGRPEVIGIHAGASRWLANSSLCAKKYGGAFQNYAVSITADMVKELGMSSHE